MARGPWVAHPWLKQSTIYCFSFNLRKRKPDLKYSHVLAEYSDRVPSTFALEYKYQPSARACEYEYPKSGSRVRVQCSSTPSMVVHWLIYFFLLPQKSIERGKCLEQYHCTQFFYFKAMLIMLNHSDCAETA